MNSLVCETVETLRKEVEAQPVPQMQRFATEKQGGGGEVKRQQQREGTGSNKGLSGIKMKEADRISRHFEHFFCKAWSLRCTSVSSACTFMAVRLVCCNRLTVRAAKQKLSEGGK